MPNADLIVDLAKAWGWTGMRPVAVVAENDFGNLLIRDDAGVYWRMSPEDVSCERVAWNDESLKVLQTEPGFVEDWEMRTLVEAGVAKFGPLPDGQKFCFRIPAVLGGFYSVGNIGRAQLRELVHFAGYLGETLKDLPDGASIELRVVG